MDKKELLKQVDDIYLILSSLSVSGDAVDAVAALRSKLRNLRSGIAKLPEAEKPATAAPVEKEVSDG